MADICRFQKEQTQCLVMTAINSNPHYTSTNICENLCVGSDGDDKISAYMSERFGRKFVICKTLADGEIIRCIRAGGLAVHLPTGDWLRTDEPLPPIVERVVPPTTALLKNLAQAAGQVITKFVVDTANDGLWAGFKGIRACKEQANMRWDKCENCPGNHLELVSEEMNALGPKLKSNRWRCLSFPGGEEGCGCWLPAKTWWAADRCNPGYWDDIDKQFGRKN